MHAARIGLQVVAGIAVVAVVYMIALWLLQRDQLVADMTNAQPPMQEVKLLDGWSYAAEVTSHIWSTVNRDATDYAPLRRSFNRKGGAQFSYSLWLRLDDTSPENVAGRTILMRGLNTAYDWQVVSVDGKLPPAAAKDVLVKCPRIRFGKTFDEIVVDFNTVSDPSASMVITSTNGGADPSLRQNALKLIAGRWAMLTFTFEDNVAINEFEDGIIVRFFLNDMPYGIGRARSALRQNHGNLYILPPTPTAPPGSGDGSGSGSSPDGSGSGSGAGTALKGARIGDVRYFNYALPLPRVRAMFNAGPPNKQAQLGGGSRSEPLYLSEYNKLDIYNS